jgi:hypothetical protein
MQVADERNHIHHHGCTADSASIYSEVSNTQVFSKKEVNILACPRKSYTVHSHFHGNNLLFTNNEEKLGSETTNESVETSTHKTLS